MRALEDLWLVTRLVLTDFARDRGIDRSAALAYVTLLSLVPLLATGTALYDAFFPMHTDEVVRFVTGFLPYSPAQVARTLTDFVDRTSKLGAVSTVVFIIIAFRLFLSIETTLNDIWQVSTRRSAATRVFTFTMIVFWGPVVMGLASTLRLWLPSTPSSDLVAELGRIGLVLLALTMVYWLAPHTGVHIRSAFVGALLGTVGLQLLGKGFRLYLQLFSDINVVFGSLTLVVVFLASLFVFWTIVILGAEAAYVVDNLAALRREHEGEQTPATSPVLTALAILLECHHRSAKGERAPTLEELEERLGIGHATASRIAERLVDAHLLALTGDERDAYVPASSAGSLTISSAITAFQKQSPAGLPASDGDHFRRLERQLASSSEARDAVLDRVTFADLVEDVEGSEEESS